MTPPNGTILDPFAGSGTTGVAALHEGFGFVGMELDPEHYRVADLRLRTTKQQIDEASTATRVLNGDF